MHQWIQGERHKKWDLLHCLTLNDDEDVQPISIVSDRTKNRTFASFGFLSLEQVLVHFTRVHIGF